MDETFTELTKAFRSVSKLIREKTEDYFGSLSPLDKALREVSDENSCTISNSLLRDLAKAANTGHAYVSIMQCVWTGITAEPWQWRRIYKCLLLLEFLVLSGPDSVQSDCSGAAMVLRNLCNFRFFEGAREEGGGVRQRASRILDLLEKPELLQEAREAAIQYAQRYGGIECPFQAMSNPFTFNGSDQNTNRRFGGNQLGTTTGDNQSGPRFLNPFSSPSQPAISSFGAQSAMGLNRNPFLTGSAAASSLALNQTRQNRTFGDNPFGTSGNSTTTTSNNQSWGTGGHVTKPLQKSYDGPSFSFENTDPIKSQQRQTNGTDNIPSSVPTEIANPFITIDDFHTSEDADKVWGVSANTQTMETSSNKNGPKLMKNAIRPRQNDKEEQSNIEASLSHRQLPDLFVDTVVLNPPADECKSINNNKKSNLLDLSLDLNNDDEVPKQQQIDPTNEITNQKNMNSKTSCNLLDLDDDSQSFEL